MSELISQKIELMRGYLHVCRVSGDLWSSWAIAPTKERAIEVASYGRGEDRIEDITFPLDLYKITKKEFNSCQGFTIRECEVRSSRGILIVSRDD